MRSNNFVAVSALMLLIVASGDAERDQAATEPAAYEAEHEAEDPSESAFIFVNCGHAGM